MPTYYNKGFLKPVVAAAYDQSSVMANMTGVSAGVKTCISLIVVAQLAFESGVPEKSVFVKT